MLSPARQLRVVPFSLCLHTHTGDVWQHHQAGPQCLASPASLSRSSIQQRQPAAVSHRLSRLRKRTVLLDCARHTGNKVAAVTAAASAAGGAYTTTTCVLAYACVSCLTPDARTPQASHQSFTPAAIITCTQDTPCAPGRPIKKQQHIRLQHAATRKWLHSHNFYSPMSGNQEVSACVFVDGGGA